jgi:phosphoribosylanthranilate isomerase
MVAIKICGVRTLEIAALCAEVATDFAGLNFVPTARRRVDPKHAKDIRQALGAVPAVGVFRDASYSDILQTIDDVQLDWVQLHGAEPPDICARIREQGISVVKAIPVTHTVLSEIERYRDAADILLFDAPLPGSGTTWSWETIASSLAQLPSHEPSVTHPLFFVAGGLTPENVATAITTLTPDGVDIASSIESNGDIDPTKVRAFCAAVRSLQPV